MDFFFACQNGTVNFFSKSHLHFQKSSSSELCHRSPWMICNAMDNISVATTNEKLQWLLSSYILEQSALPGDKDNWGGGHEWFLYSAKFLKPMSPMIDVMHLIGCWYTKTKTEMAERQTFLKKPFCFVFFSLYWNCSFFFPLNPFVLFFSSNLLFGSLMILASKRCVSPLLFVSRETTTTTTTAALIFLNNWSSKNSKNLQFRHVVSIFGFLLMH